MQPVGGQVVDQAGDEGAGTRYRVEDLHVLVGQTAAEVLLQQVVRAADDEIHHLVGCVHHAQSVGCGGIIRLVEILIDGLEKLLLFRVLGNLVGGPSDGPVVCPQPIDGLPAHVAGEERPLQRGKLPGDVVLAMVLDLSEDPLKDVLGQEMLQQHLPHVGLGDRGADAAVTQF